MNPPKNKQDLILFAPAKINLYLHITGQLDNGYHTLDSLVGFADIGDKITITPSHKLSFKINGSYARAFSREEYEYTPSSKNIIIRALWALAKAFNKTPDIHITLEKNLPLASGLGGGSSNAATLIWGMAHYWDIPLSNDKIPDILKELGADVPVCLKCLPSHMQGIGDILTSAPPMPEIPIILINPEKSCSTAGIFEHCSPPFKEPVKLPENFCDIYALISFLKAQNNDLQHIACKKLPEINNILYALEKQNGTLLTRMTGSGATVFALFENEDLAKKAAQTLSKENPDWWVKQGYLNRPERY